MRMKNYAAFLGLVLAAALAIFWWREYAAGIVLGAASWVALFFPKRETVRWWWRRFWSWRRFRFRKLGRMAAAVMLIFCLAGLPMLSGCDKALEYLDPAIAWLHENSSRAKAEATAGDAGEAKVQALWSLQDEEDAAKKAAEALKKAQEVIKLNRVGEETKP